MRKIMKASDTVSAKLAECFATVGTKRYNIMQMIDLEAKFEKQKSEVAILGRPGKANKPSGWKGTFSGKMHYNTSIFRKMLLHYKDTGEDIYFDIQITNDDGGSSVGKQTITLIDCNLDGGVLAKFDANSDDPLDEEISGTFEDFKMPSEFKEITGFRA